MALQLQWLFPLLRSACLRAAAARASSPVIVNAGVTLAWWIHNANATFRSADNVAQDMLIQCVRPSHADRADILFYPTYVLHS